MRWQVRVVPKADVSTRSKQLLDYLVGEQLQRVGYLDAKRPGRLQVDTFDDVDLGKIFSVSTTPAIYLSFFGPNSRRQ